jgi:hypothetical protein
LPSPKTNHDALSPISIFHHFVSKQPSDQRQWRSTSFARGNGPIDFKRNLLRTNAAIDWKGVAGDVPGLVGQQPYNGVGDQDDLQAVATGKIPGEGTAMNW